MEYPIVVYTEQAKIIRSYYRYLETIKNIPAFIRAGYRKVK